MRVTVLGSGWSPGVPVLGCDCAVCRSPDPRNRRLRCSVLVEGDGGRRVLIDASPDLRAQLLAANVTALDAVVFTHAHADHCHGIDDLRLVCRAMGRPLDVYADAESLEELRRRFGYAFKPFDGGWFRPVLIPHVIEGPFVAGGLPIETFRQAHGPTMTSLGVRIGGFAYSTDVSDLDEDAFRALEGLELWIVDCQNAGPNYVHSNLERTLGWIERVKPARAVLTHLSHDFEHGALCAGLRPGLGAAFDGLVIDVSGPGPVSGDLTTRPRARGADFA